MAACGVMGIIATFLFTWIQNCMGLECTGVLAFSLEISCLVLCLVSVWAPGSPFDPNYFKKQSELESQQQNCTSSGNNTLCKISESLPKGINMTVDSTAHDSTSYAMVNNSSADNSTDTDIPKDSAILFVAGVITARVGMSSFINYNYKSKMVIHVLDITCIN